MLENIFLRNIEWCVNGNMGIPRRCFLQFKKRTTWKKRTMGLWCATEHFPSTILMVQQEMEKHDAQRCLMQSSPTWGSSPTTFHFLVICCLFTQTIWQASLETFQWKVRNDSATDGFEQSKWFPKESKYTLMGSRSYSRRISFVYAWRNEVQRFVIPSAAPETIELGHYGGCVFDSTICED
jgi:hypothetical protein